MSTLLAALLCLGAALVGGVFLAFSSFVMRALREQPPAHGIAAMQRINVVVLNPLFLGLFVGTALLAAGAAALALWQGDGPRAALLLAAAACYLVGSFGVTLACNVPRNERLARLPAGSPEAAAYWPAYVREWLRWNHVRTVACTLAAAAALGALLP